MGHRDNKELEGSVGTIRSCTEEARLSTSNAANDELEGRPRHVKFAMNEERGYLLAIFE